MDFLRKYKFYFLVPVLIFIAFMILMFMASGSDQNDPFVYQFF